MGAYTSKPLWDQLNEVKCQGRFTVSGVGRLFLLSNYC